MFDDIITEKPKIIKAQKKSRLEKLIEEQAKEDQDDCIYCSNECSEKDKGPNWKKTKDPKTGRIILKRSA